MLLELKPPDIPVGIIKPDRPSQSEITDAIYCKTDGMCTARSFERYKILPAIRLDRVFDYSLGAKKRNGIPMIIAKAHVGGFANGKGGGSTGEDMVDPSTVSNPTLFENPSICFCIEHVQVI